MKKFLLLSVVASLICGCSSSLYYQLYKVSTNGMEQKNNQLIYENEHCIISYDLWSESGDLSFMLFNKTDKDLFVVMPQTFFIQNGIAYDYYTNETQTSRQVAQVGKAIAYSNSYTMGLSKSTAYAQSVTSENITTAKEMEVICIPPKAAKLFKGFTLISNAHKDCDDYEFNYPKKFSDAITFEKDNSPWKFRNRIAYTLDGDNNECRYVENELWVSFMQNYYYTEMQKSVKESVCEMNYPNYKMVLLNRAPDAFYNKYTKTAGAGSRTSSLEGGKSNDDLYSVRNR